MVRLLTATLVILLYSRREVSPPNPLEGKGVEGQVHRTRGEGRVWSGKSTEPVGRGGCGGASPPNPLEGKGVEGQVPLSRGEGRVWSGKSTEPVGRGGCGGVSPPNPWGGKGMEG